MPQSVERRVCGACTLSSYESASVCSGDGERCKEGRPASQGSTVIALHCIRHCGLRKENACLGEVVGGPVVMDVYVCLQGACPMATA